MAFSFVKHLQAYSRRNEKEAKECAECVAPIESGNEKGHEQLMKIKKLLDGYAKEVPEGYEVFVLNCCRNTAQDQVVFAVTRELNYRDKANFARFDDWRKVDRITHQSPHVRFSLSPRCDTLVATIDVPSHSKVEKEVQFSEDYTDLVSTICEQYLQIVFPVIEA